MNRDADAKRARRFEIAGRALAAVPLNYAVTTTLVVLIARTLPARANEASMAAMVLSFAIFAVLAMTAFAMRSVVKLWLFFLGAGILAGLADWLSIAWDGRL